MSLMYEILYSQQEDRPRDALPCCNDYAGSVCRRQCGLRHHTCNTQDPCRHFCRTSRCSHRSAGHHCRLPLVAPSCLAAVESCSWTSSFCALLLCMPSLSEDLKNQVLEDVSVRQSGAVQQHILFQCSFVVRCSTMHMFMLAVMISPKRFSRI